MGISMGTMKSLGRALLTANNKTSVVTGTTQNVLTQIFQLRECNYIPSTTDPHESHSAIVGTAQA